VTVKSVSTSPPITSTSDSEPVLVSIPRANLWQRLLSGGLWVVGARFFGVTSTVLANAVLARQIAPEAFGDFVVVCSIANAASLVAIFGMNSGVVRFVAEQLAHDNRTGARHVLRLCYRLAAYAIFVTTLVVFVGMYISRGHFLSLARPTQIAVLTACALAIQAFGNLNAAALRGLGEMRYSSVLGGQAGAVGPMANSLFLVLVAGFAWITQMTLIGVVSAYVAALAIGLVVGSGWLLRTASSVLGPRESNPIAAESAPTSAWTILAACLPMLLVQILSVASKQGGVWVAGAACSPQELALYAGANRAIQLVGIPLSLINLSVMAFIPQLRMQGRLRELERILRVSAGWAAIPSFLALLAFLLAPAQILEIFLGPKYRGAAGLLSILSLGQFVLVWVGCSELVLVLSGHARSAAVANAVAACTILAGGPLVTQLYGSSGLAVLASAVIVGQGLAQWILTRTLLRISTHATFFPWRMPETSAVMCVDR
jgi:O-antigen/teichoic acid export membrane protein